MTPVPHPAAPARPCWHVSPPVGWLNDPNGLVHADSRWHAFHQHHPASDVWGPMHWGHASSLDGLHWEHHPIALEPDGLGTIYSGSVVVDGEGVAGVGRGAWVALFTHHTDLVEQQSMAWSTDGGITWTKHPDNPVLRGDTDAFRDPKVRRMPDGTWHMVTTLGDRVARFRSDDLVHWSPAGMITAELDTGVGVWECPDLVRLDDGSWWLVLSLSTGGVDGHSGTVAVPLRQVGASFEQSGVAVRLDHGPDWYAAQTFSGTPVSESPGEKGVVAMAWLNSWRYANHVPSSGWRGILSLPRAMTVVDGTLRQWPAVRPPSPSPATDAGAHWVTADRDVVVTIDGPHGAVRAGVEGGTAFVERHGLAAACPEAAGHDGRFEVAVPAYGPHVVVVDHGSVEVFAAAGSATVSAQVFVGPAPSVHVRRL